MQYFCAYPRSTLATLAAGQAQTLRSASKHVPEGLPLCATVAAPFIQTLQTGLPLCPALLHLSHPGSTAVPARLQQPLAAAQAQKALLHGFEAAVWHPQTLQTLRSASKHVPEGWPLHLSNPGSSLAAVQAQPALLRRPALAISFEAAVWHPQTLQTLRSASKHVPQGLPLCPALLHVSHPGSTAAPARLRQPLAAAQAQKALLYGFEAAVWHPQTLQTLRSASKHVPEGLPLCPPLQHLSHPGSTLAAVQQHLSRLSHPGSTLATAPRKLFCTVSPKETQHSGI